MIRNYLPFTIHEKFIIAIDQNLLFLKLQNSSHSKFCRITELSRFPPSSSLFQNVPNVYFGLWIVGFPVDSNASPKAVQLRAVSPLTERTSGTKQLNYRRPHI
jgi:hypothetical protein